jgi:uncharacterized protein (UPF0332 family)
MTLPSDLLEQAQFLVLREPRRPKQASLRRAVSTAYYASFHLLCSEAADQASPASPVELCNRVQRAMTHGTMKTAAKAFESGNLPNFIKSLVSAILAAEISSVARAFVQLQEERHKADYDIADRFDRARAQNAVSLSTQLFADWNTIRDTDDARVFLAALLFWNIWSK